MQYDQEIVEDIVIVRIHETKLTSHESPDLKTALLGLIVGKGEYLLINLSNLEYMDSTALGGFLFGIRQAERYDKEIIFCGMNPRIQSLIKIAHLDQIIEVYRSEKDALKAIKDEKKDI